MLLNLNSLFASIFKDLRGTSPKMLFKHTPESCHLDITDGYSIQAKFSREECLRIINIGKSHQLHNGTTGSSASDYRRSKICWLPNDNTTGWIYDRLEKCVLEANLRWEIRVYGFGENLQFTEYDEKYQGHYNTHMDLGRDDNMRFRKISIVVHLTDPSEFQGGELILHTAYNALNGRVMENEQGTVTLFPSFLLHKVTPVTKGRRYSLVLWVTGPPFS